MGIQANNLLPSPCSQWYIEKSLRVYLEGIWQYQFFVWINKFFPSIKQIFSWIFSLLKNWGWIKDFYWLFLNMASEFCIRIMNSWGVWYQSLSVKEWCIHLILIFFLFPWIWILSDRLRKVIIIKQANMSHMFIEEFRFIQ